MIGRIVSTLSLTRLQKYSLFQKYSALSATWDVVSTGQPFVQQGIPGNGGSQQIWPAD
jgi:hypothetical protein